jgi:hypothetical protein
MKRTLAAFFLALALLLGALSLPGDRPETSAFLPLVLEGVETVEIVSRQQPNVFFSATLAPGVDYQIEKDKGVTSRREGSRLVIESTLASYSGITVNLPPTVRRLVVLSADVEVRLPLESLVLQVAGNLQWSGDIAQLEILHDGIAGMKGPAGNESDAAKGYCSGHCDGWVTLESGRIGRLVASSARGHIELSRSDDIGEAHLRLGEEASFALGVASRLDHIHLEPFEAPATAPADTETPEP